MKPFLLFLVCLCGMGQALAEPHYVTDMAEIMLRKGGGTGYRIIRIMKSGELVEELSANRKTGYSQVRTKDGTNGYVLTRQLQKDPVARDQLAAMEARLAEFQQTPDQLTTKLNELRSEHEQLQTDHRQLEQEKDKLAEELASLKHTSDNLVNISRERLELNNRVEDLTRQITELQQKNRDLKNDVTQRWFLIGAGVVIGSILVGLVLPHLRFRRRKSSWSKL